MAEMLSLVEPGAASSPAGPYKAERNSQWVAWLTELSYAYEYIPPLWICANTLDRSTMWASLLTANALVALPGYTHRRDRSM